MLPLRKKIVEGYKITVKTINKEEGVIGGTKAGREDRDKNKRIEKRIVQIKKEKVNHQIVPHLLSQVQARTPPLEAPKVINTMNLTNYKYYWSITNKFTINIGQTDT